MINRKKKTCPFVQLFTLCFISFFIFAFSICKCQVKHQNSELSVTANDTVKKQLDTLIIVGVGDVMLGTDYPSKSYLPPSGSCKNLLDNVKSYLQSADVTFGNMEGVFAGNNGIAKKCNNPTQCYVFRMPERYVDCIIEGGFDIVSVANNHINDFGSGGRKNTEKVLDNAGLKFAGFESRPYTIFIKDSIRYGFCAFAPHTGTLNMKDMQTAIALIKKLDTISDVVIVSIHAGAEGKNHQNVTRQDEVFLGYNRGNVYNFTHAAIDAGADVIFGHGPHVTRAIEVYKNRLIAYSLGNFCTYGRFNLSGPNGFAPIIRLYTDKKGCFLKAQVIPVYQEGEGIPKIDPMKRAIIKLIELTKEDFPEQKLIINDEGWITLTK